ncbi:MAG: hypothetical protein ACOYM3_04720 [Terrimicrobiaceae bacterium]
MIAIATAATKSYLHAWPQCVRAIAAAAAHHAEAHFIFATDDSKEGARAEEVAKSELPSGWPITAIRLAGINDDAKDYNHAAQLRIAALQGAAFAVARSKVRADMLWSVESDNIVPANSLRVLEWTLAMPTADGSPYYDIAAGTYPNGLFLGGFGTPQNPIAEDFLPSERKLNPRLKLCLDACEARLKLSISQSVTERESKRMGRLRARVKKSPPDGNIWEVTAKHGWRRRGWMDFAYPGIGEGSVVPSDWCGLGCTLMSKRALALADFCGYDGGGTQDLFLCWHRWHPAGLRLACVPHVLCDHVKREGSAYVHHRAYHEQAQEYRGHLRVRSQPWTPV